MDYSDLLGPFIDFTAAAINMKEYLARNVDPFNHIGQLTVGFFEEITKIQGESRIIHEEVRMRGREGEREGEMKEG